MVEKIHRNVEMELREGRNGPMLHGTIVQEGRAATGGRAELFAPGSVTWPENGIGIKVGHDGTEESRTYPVRSPNGEIRIAAKATERMVRAVREGKTGMSVEFIALSENRTKGGVRELTRALVDAAAMTATPEYQQGRAELRAKRGYQIWL